MLKKKENVAKIERLFEGFNFDFVKTSPTELTIVMLCSAKVMREYKDFLLKKKYLPTDDVDLILKYLTQVKFSDLDLFEKLKHSHYMKLIVDLIESSSIPVNTPGYYKISAQKAMVIGATRQVVEQVKLRVISEKTEMFSVALNHLLNEIHAICLLMDTSYNKNPKQYDSNEVSDFLHKSGVPHDICTKIRNLFDRRNSNQVSHPALPKSVVWSVSRDEYHTYRDYVGQCLDHIL